MSVERSNCPECGASLARKSGRGRPRVYCGPACRNVAYERRKGDAPPSPQPRARQPEASPPGGLMTMVELIGALQQSIAVQDAEMIVDAIVEWPEAVEALMVEIVMRVATQGLLEDVRYQPAIDRLVTAYRMIGRITEGDFKLPAVTR